MINKNEIIDSKSKISLSQFLVNEQRTYNLPIFLPDLLQSIASASKIVYKQIASTIWKYKITEKDHIHFNPSGDVQGELDIIAQDVFAQTIVNCPSICGIISEESASFIPGNKDGEYFIALDPLDGSANIAVNAPVGTLFSIYLRQDNKPDLDENIFLLPGKYQLAAGYMLYSTVTTFVYATVKGVHSFRYDDRKDDFFLMDAHMKMPQTGVSYAINHGYLNHFPTYIRTYLSHCNRQECASRYTGALVADFHRHLVEGGIYLYPPTYKRPNGKLRLMFECNVLAFIAHQAGGLASNGKDNILEIMPRALHQPTPFYIGSSTMVQSLLSYLKSDMEPRLLT